MIVEVGNRHGNGFVDRTGQRYGRLVVQALDSTKPATKWLCLCDCGSVVKVLAGQLGAGRTKSCGCLRKEVSADLIRKVSYRGPGHSRRTEYAVWAGIKQRCLNPNTKSFPRYGGRGITICERWKNSFTNFYSDMGPRPDGTSIDRIDNDGHYEPSNCRWATEEDQRNNKRSNYRVAVDGRTLTIAQAARKYGVVYSNLYHRIVTLGWPIERALAQ